MTREELLEKARKDFPIGTQYYPVGYPNLIKECLREPKFAHATGNYIDAGWGYLYHNDMWARPVYTDLEIARQIIYSD